MSLHVRTELRRWAIAELAAATIPHVTEIVGEAISRVGPGVAVVTLHDSAREHDRNVTVFGLCTEVAALAVHLETTGADELAAVEAAEAAEAEIEAVLVTAARADPPAAAGIDTIASVSTELEVLEGADTPVCRVMIGLRAELRRQIDDPRNP